MALSLAPLAILTFTGCPHMAAQSLQLPFELISPEFLLLLARDLFNIETLEP